MKNKGFIVFLVLTMLMTVTTLAYANEIRGEAFIVEKENEFIEVNVYTETKDVFSKDIFDKVFSKKDKSFLENDLNADINYLKDSVEVIIKTRINPSIENKLILYDDNNPIEVSSKGTILIPKDTKVVSKSELLKDEYFYENISDSTIGLDSFNTSIIEMTNANESEIVFKASSGELLAVMDEKEDRFLSTNNSAPYRKGYGDKYYPGDWVHCNRFNGSSTDDVH
ncbi:hypothetical protein [Clostridium tetani]|nr:hypothetical protein [Clostridium tetani]